MRSISKNIGSIKRFIPIFAIALLGAGSLVFADSVHQPNPCSGSCTNVAALPKGTTTANINLPLLTITVKIQQNLAGESVTSPVVGVPGDRVFIELSNNRFTCTSATDTSGVCKITNVPSGFDGKYSFQVERFVGNTEFDNLPFILNSLNLTNDPNAKNITVTLFEPTACDKAPPNPRCSGDFLQSPEQCVLNDPRFPKGFFEFNSPGIDCGTLNARVCPGGLGIARGTCEVNPSTKIAGCVDGSCSAFEICSFSTPFNLNHPDGFFRPGEVVELNGDLFGNEGGEVRVGNVSIFIDPNDPRSNFTWNNNLIRFVLPPEARTATIGVRPKGYGFKVGLDGLGNTVFLVDEEGFLIPVFCIGGLLKVAEFPDLSIAPGSEVIPVSVSGG